jgi:hypothetical protein
MKYVRACPVCASSALHTRPAITAPFIAKRIWDAEPFSIEFVTCSACSFRFFNPRLEPHEEAKLYASYRDERYQEERFAFEAFYTKAFNDGLSSRDALAARRSRLAGVLRPFVAGGTLRSVLDFGGASGELVAGLVPGATTHVYDVSGVDTVPGVTSCASLAECREICADLIVCSNVLEHVAAPRSMMRELAGLARRGTLIFVEVPFEAPQSPLYLLKQLAKLGVLAAQRPRVFRRLRFPAALYQMHEHVNLFDGASLERVVALDGLEMRAQGTYASRGPLPVTMGFCVAERVAAPVSPPKRALRHQAAGRTIA